MKVNVTKGKLIGNIIGIAVATILIIFAFCGRYVEGGFKQFGNFFLGSFGMSFYGIMAAIIVACSFSLAGKSIKIPVKYIVFFALLFVSVIMLVHMFSTFALLENNIRYVEFSTYSNYVYSYYDNVIGIPTFGGIVFGSIVYGLTAALTIWGAMIVIIGLLVVSVIFVGDFFYCYFTGKLKLHSKTTQQDIQPSETTSETSFAEDNISNAQQRAFEILFKEDHTYPEEVSTTPSEEKFDTAPQSTLDNSKGNNPQTAADILFGHYDDRSSQSSSGGGFFTPLKKDEPKQGDDEFIVRGYYPSEPIEKKVEEDVPSSNWKVSTPPEITPSVEEVSTQPISEQTVEPTPVNKQPHQSINDEAVDIADIVVEEESKWVDEPIVAHVQEEPEEQEEEFDIDEPISSVEQQDEDEILAIPRDTIIETSTGKAVQEGLDFITRADYQKVQETVHKYSEYNLPPFELLNDVTIVEDDQSEDRQRAAEAIVSKLNVFGIKVETANIVVGPSVTRYMFRVLSQKTRMSEFARFSDDIKACIEAQEDIRIDAPVHGTNLVGIEVANKKKTPVVLRSLLESSTFKNAKGNLVFAIGQEITGKVIVADLSDMPHLLIAGTTGSGKSVCLNCMIVSLMYKYSPEYVRFVMVDPKFVELSRYNGIPHMLTSETITNTNDALAGLDYLINEMEARYQLFRSNSVGNIGEYNARINPKITQKLPYLVFIVDELADLMAVSKQAFESKLQRLAQKSRAAGIHIVLATQRPDVKTITGTIKANLPCRMALKVASQFDSNTIIGGGGAEKLLGKGDMLFMSPGSPDLERVQGAYISNDEIRALVEFSKESNEVYYDEKVSEEIFVSRKQAEEAALEQERERDGVEKESQLDPLCKKALRFWLEKNQGKASIASIQRNLGIGFNRAGRIMDSLQQLKYVETPPPSETNSKPLKVLVTLEELDDLFPDMPD